MAIEFKLPELGENIESGDVVNVLVAVGDTVSKDQPVIELETDKAVVEVPAPFAGTVQQIHVAAGDTVAVGQAIVSLDAADDAGQADQPGTQPAQSAGTAEHPVAMRPAEAHPPAPAPAAPEDVAAGAPSAEEQQRTYPAPAAAGPKMVPAAPSVRRLAREIGVDVTRVTGSGPGGRISQDDVKSHARQLNATRQQEPGGAAGMPVQALELPDFSQWGEVERKPISKVRRLTASRLQASWQTTPMVTQFDKADATELEKWRKQFAPRVEQAGGKLTVTAILIKVVGAALKVFPQFNTSFDQVQGEIIQKHYIHIGVAVDTPHGLLVPVIRNVDQKNITELSIELVGIAAKTRERKVALGDMQGGSITISNVGAIGGTGFTPVINPPEVAILGVARTAQEPVYMDGTFQPRLLLPLCLSYDHRVIDGVDGARFLRWVADALGNPFILALEG